MKIPFVSKRSNRSSEADAGPSNPPPAVPQPPSPARSAAASASSSSPAAAAPGAGEEDFISQEEEYQMQLAMALSASASVGGGGAGDPDGEQIRKAKLMSLGRGAAGDRGGGDSAESLSRRYREYNFLDYNEKVIDGFYDIFGLSAESSRQKKIPSLAELQMSIGDLGFEVIVIDHKFDNALREMKEVAQCCLLGCADISVSVRRIAEVVAEHMGGPVLNANEMFTKWLGKSIEQRTSHQTSLLPIGRIEIGLSRHRALLFKILADSVGIPCKLVKGSHYTGVEDDAINIIKMDNDREYLVDIMAAPGTLIPADVFNSKGTSFNTNQTLGQNQTTDSVSNMDNEPVALQSERKHNQLHLPSNINWIPDNHSGYENTTTLSAQNPWAETLSMTAGSSASAPCALAPQMQSGQLSTAGDLSKQKEDLKLLPDSQDNKESKKLFSDLNPSRAIGSRKSSVAFKGLDNRNNEFQRRRENVAPVPARSHQPLVIKNWSAFNDISNNKQYNFAEGLVPRRNIIDNVASSSQVPWSAGKHYNSNSAERNNRSYAAPVHNYDNGMIGTSPMTTASTSRERLDRSNMGAASDFDVIGTSSVNTACTYGIGRVAEKGPCDDVERIPMYSRFDGQLSANAQGFAIQANENKENYGKQDHKKLYPNPRTSLPDRFMGAPKDHSGSVSPSQVGSSRVDMLEDVSECEVLWEDLAIGERIGLGSYGEVYHADWNGTEVAVKKFLDQEFYGDALDEFRCEVRIMRRLRHPNIVLFMGAVTRPPNLSILSEYLRRGSLHKIIHRPNCEIDEKRRIKMALDVARGMNCLHTSVPTIVHRDLKSPNLLVDDNWTVKVCDFGLSRLKHSTFLSSRSTAGTPEWMAPEVLRNERSNENTNWIEKGCAICRFLEL
ncbi:serine/threonine-protein kinase EDR1-like isoform X2 [Phragmites australis]|uniref:serine/threonine-protein kinase EDR1-like isoform X2 n=1 Tax=Phragmites australis TaxID=29695 RepID=UPI002D77830C|nr:serine/threonine-protein kinase EDR1-like isoform X2 [Phragmites australis]